MKFNENKWRFLAATKLDEPHSFIPQSSIIELFDEIERLEHEITKLKEANEDAQSRLDDYRQENKSRLVYIVTMYRYGDREKHSYVYGAFSTEATAREWGEEEKDYRGGKYEPEIIRLCVDSPTDFLKVKNA